jgi:NAD(P) transhydrogenase subunit alpha
MIVGVCKETFGGEKRVALIPAHVPALKDAGLDVSVEAGAGNNAGFHDGQYEQKGARIAPWRQQVFDSAGLILQVRASGANPNAGRSDLKFYRKDQIVIGLQDPLSEPETVQEFARTGVASFALELIPRITRAQSMDALSSMATIAGYKSVLLAAGALPRMFPMLMTAAGTVAPARVFVIGAGVAGLQAIATARRLGALVQAYDVRPAVRQEVESLGAKFVDLGFENPDHEGSGEYAREMDEAFYQRQREVMTRVVAESNVVITTAAVPGRKAPILVTGDMVKKMPAGSVIVDIAAERGGNCELTRPGELVHAGSITIMGLLNLPSTIPYHASQMYSKNVTSFLLNLVEDGEPNIDRDDEIIRETMITRGGEVVHAAVRERLGLAPLPSQGEEPSEEPEAEPETKRTEPEETASESPGEENAGAGKPEETESEEKKS